MSPGSEVVIAGGGIAGAATAIRLRRLGFGARMLVRADGPMAGIEALPQRALALLDVLGEPQLVMDAGGVAVAGDELTPPRVHVERRALARMFLDRARARGAVVVEVDRLAPAAEMLSDAVAVIDATGRAAAWSRPVLTDGHDVAWQFEGPPRADLALRIVRDDRWWAYRLGTPSATWAGVVATGMPGAPSTAGPDTDEALRALGLDPAAMAPRGRRAARVQRAVHPAAGSRIAVGDAALAHDPIAGTGIRFALASAVAAATAVATRLADPGSHDLANAYFNDLVAGEHRRHLEARRAIHRGDRGVTDHASTPSGWQAPVLPETVRFAADVVETSVALDGLVRPGAAVRLPDGTITRWAGSFDLLVLARLSSTPVPRIVLLARLQQEGLDVGDARAVLTWAVRHGLLSG